jgi:indolepyruvate ferredoxin oxidoreductase
MAFKDEYEVARLMLLPEARAAAEAVGGLGANFSWKLHPPALRALGRTSKMSFGSWTSPVFMALRSGKRLRGTRFDPFGRTELRRLERKLPGEYLDALERVYRALDRGSFDLCVEIAELPDHVRGYENLKMRRIGEYRERLRRAIEALLEHDASAPTRVEPAN